MRFEKNNLKIKNKRIRKTQKNTKIRDHRKHENTRSTKKRDKNKKNTEKNTNTHKNKISKIFTVITPSVHRTCTNPQSAGGFIPIGEDLP